MGTVLYPHSILDIDDLMAETLGSPSPRSAQDDRLKDVLNSVTDLIESAVDRRLMCRGGEQTRFYSPTVASSFLDLDEWPVRNVRAWASATRSYTTELIEDTDFIVESSDHGARLVRITTTGELSSWTLGYRAVKVVCGEGYRRASDSVGSGFTLDAPVLPGDIKRAAARTAARIWSEIKRQGQGMQSTTMPDGTRTNFSEAIIGYTDASILRNYARLGMGAGRRGVQ
jgi:hypothetical protein